MSKKKSLGIKLRKFNRSCPITGYKEDSIKIGAPVVVQTDRGVEYGQIVEFKPGSDRTSSQDVRLKKVLRYATSEDIDKAKTLAELEAKATKITLDKIIEYELPIKLASLEYLFDTSRVMIYYKVKDGSKVKSLRELTRDLATSLEARVTLKQISPRDEARFFGGLGPCGKTLCCCAWLDKPRHVTVKMAKEQGLSISPTKTSGMCGRLMCCLEYEYDKR